jgi:hypothetical protein
LTVETTDTAGDRAALSKTHRQTLDMLFAHPIARNLDWHDVLGLLGALGSVAQMPNNETDIQIGTAHQKLRCPHGKDLTLDEVMELRHFLTRAGVSKQPPPQPADAADVLVAIDHHEARVYHLDLRPGDPDEHVIRPADPHHFLHHLTHKDQTRQRGERAAEDPAFYEHIAQAVAAVAPHGRIVVVGHGQGHSDAAHHFVAWMHLHHTETAQRLAGEIVADLSALTPPQLLALGREALAAPG